MASKCVKCDKEVPQHGSEVIKCIDCSGYYHSNCASSDHSKKIGSKRTWKCESCVSDCASNSSSKSRTEREPSNASVLDAIAAFRKDFNDRWDKSSKQLEKVQNDIKDITLEVSDLKKQFESTKLVSNQTLSLANTLKEENKLLQEEMAKLKIELGDLQQHSRKNNVLISGIPVTQNENVYAILMSVARVLEIDYQRYDISVAHRLRAAPNDKRPPSIVVSFVSRTIRSNWLASAKTKGPLLVRGLHPTFPNTADKFFVNEHLSTETRALFNLGRALKRDNKLSSVWVSDGRILVKVLSDGPVRRVRTEQDFQMLLSSRT